MTSSRMVVGTATFFLELLLYLRIRAMMSSMMLDGVDVSSSMVPPGCIAEETRSSIMVKAGGVFSGSSLVIEEGEFSFSGF